MIIVNLVNGVSTQPFRVGNLRVGVVLMLLFRVSFSRYGLVIGCS